VGQVAPRRSPRRLVRGRCARDGADAPHVDGRARRSWMERACGWDTFAARHELSLEGEWGGGEACRFSPCSLLAPPDRIRPGVRFHTPPARTRGPPPLSFAPFPRNGAPRSSSSAHRPVRPHVDAIPTLNPLQSSPAPCGAERHMHTSSGTTQARRSPVTAWSGT